MSRLYVCCSALLVFACEHPRAPAPAAPSAPSVPPVPRTLTCQGLTIELEAPDANAPSATLTIRREGEGMAPHERGTCVRIGERVVRLAPGERGTFTLRADARRLQRIMIGGKPLLASIRPGDAWQLGDQPCFGWDLSGPRSDPWSAASPLAYCAKHESEPCRSGFYHASPPRPVKDELCGSTEQEIKRCAAAAEIRFASASPPAAPTAIPEDAMSITELAASRHVQVEARSCGFLQIATAAETVWLATGVGETWQLSLDPAGHVQGEAL